MQYDDGTLIKDFTSIDNDVIRKIYRSKNLSTQAKNVLLSLCRQVFYQVKAGVVQTERWGAVYVTAKDVGISERTVRRAYKTLQKMNVIKVSQVPRLTTDKNGNQVFRKTNSVKFNTQVHQWAI
jgi:DNA-binding transcriptional regulator YhcF (GntR family)